MKKLFLIAAIAVASITVSFAQAYEKVVLLSTANGIANSLLTGWLVDEGDTTNYTALNLTARVEGADKLAIAVGAALAGTGTGDLEIYFQRSIDGLLWETTPSIALTNVSTSNTRKQNVHLVDAEGAAYIRLHSIKNADDAEDATNIVVTVGIKPK